MDTTIYAATKKGVFQITRQSKRWAIACASMLGDDISMVLPDRRDGTVYATPYHGHFGPKLKRSRDGGATWDEITTPTFPKQPEGETDVDGFGKVVVWKVNKIWRWNRASPTNRAFFGAARSQAACFARTTAARRGNWCARFGTIRGARNGSAAAPTCPGIHSICVHPRDSKTVSVGVSCGGVWVTRDGGQSWKCQADGMRAEYMPPELAGDPGIQDPHRLVQCLSQPDCLWVQHHNGIFRSDNASATWQEITNVPPSAFGFAVAVHPVDPKTAWFIPGIKDERRIPVDGKLVVTRTRDGRPNVRRIAHRLAAGARLRHRLSPCPRHRHDRPGARVRHDDRLVLRLGRSRRSLAVCVGTSATSVLRAIRVVRGQKSEGRSQRAEVRGQISEIRSSRPDV